MKIIRRIFPFMDDKSKNYFEFYKQINLVPDIKDRKLYLSNIKNLKLFFSGQKKKIFKNLEKQMKDYAKLREFEKAGEIKRQIFALKHINDVALIKNDSLLSQKHGVHERTLGRSGGDGQRKFLAKNFRGESENAMLEDNNLRIEAYDVAHMSGKNMVGVMTVLINSEPDKNEYRKFKIRTQDNSNDTGALAEILERRFAHIEWQKPDLIVVDGGIAQINVARKVMSRLNLDIIVVSVVKDERHRPKNILFSPKPDLKGSQGSAFIKKYKQEILLVNNEAHRFAIAYHKKLRAKNFLK
jgi:excinuclease ABC subunit C